MAYPHVKTPAAGKIAVNELKYQVCEPSRLPAVKDERISSTGSSISTPLHSGAAMIETIFSVIILLVMSMVFKGINAKQREFDRLEDKRR
jgi:hypothetical protein